MTNKNNRKSTNGRHPQVVNSKPAKKLVGEYLSKSGQVKNRYVADPESKPTKTIKHKIQ